MASSRPELCAECGKPLRKDPLRISRLCPQHLREAQKASGPFACSTAVIDEGYGEALPFESKGTLRAVGLTRHVTCCFCGAPLDPGGWAVKVPGHGWAQTQCAGDEGWEID